jgi:hypothetical protein
MTYEYLLNHRPGVRAKMASRETGVGERREEGGDLQVFESVNFFPPAFGFNSG